MKKINSKMVDFINATPNAYYCVDNLKNKLEASGFIELQENEMWNNLKKDGNYFVIRNDSSLIAFKLTSNRENLGFNIISAHTDSPSFSIKPNADIFDNYYLKLNVNAYGGMINYSWLDRPLSLAGRIITKTSDFCEKKLVNIDKDLMIIPSQAIHINREVNDKNALNRQIDMLPIVALTNEKKLDNIIMDSLIQAGVNVDEILDYDLYAYNRDKAKYIGLNDEMILGPRLDDLSSVFPAAEAFINSTNNYSINVLCAFDNEEIGSLTQQGADSTFLSDVLFRIAKSLNVDIYVALRNSFVVSADNAHALHPNAQSKSDPSNKVLLNNGIVVKHHINYTTDALTSSLFKEICQRAEVPYQDFACRSDMRCGATLGGISQSHVGVDSIDIGLPQLAMHSANETIGSKDVLYMYKSLLEFYNTQFIKEKNTVKLLNRN